MGTPYVERVRSRRGPHPGPTMDTASGCGTTREGWVPGRGAVRRREGWVPAWGAERRLPPRLTGENRYPWWCDGGGDRPYVERVRSRRGPHPGPTMDTASGCGKTREGWVPDRGAERRGRGVTAVGTALTSSGFVVEGVPTRAPPWIPHRGAVRRGRGGYRVGVRKDGCHLVLPVKTGIHGGVTAVGTALTSSGFVAEGVPTRAPPWIPHRGAVRRPGGGDRVGVRYDGVV